MTEKQFLVLQSVILMILIIGLYQMLRQLPKKVMITLITIIAVMMLATFLAAIYYPNELIGILDFLGIKHYL